MSGQVHHLYRASGAVTAVIKATSRVSEVDPFEQGPNRYVTGRERCSMRTRQIVPTLIKRSSSGGPPSILMERGAEDRLYVYNRLAEIFDRLKERSELFPSRSTQVLLSGISDNRGVGSAVCPNGGELVQRC